MQTNKITKRFQDLSVSSTSSEDMIRENDGLHSKSFKGLSRFDVGLRSTLKKKQKNSGNKTEQGFTKAQSFA